MPYKSEAQRKLFHHLVAQGKLSPKTVAEFDRESKGKHFPEHVQKKAFGGRVQANHGVRCPACDYPLDQVGVALDAGEACPRCGFGNAKDVPHHARGGMMSDAVTKSHSGHGGEMMEPTTYRAHGGQIHRHAMGVLRPSGGGGGLESAAYAVAHGGKMPGYADGGKVMRCAHCGAPMAHGGYSEGGEVGGMNGNMKELYPVKPEHGADLDDGKIKNFGGGFASAVKRRRR